ncbi:MAG: hypothetical protein Q4G25_08340 [Paracoccus sp. (in: a-proteobacteria)]|nr:hypothetical protein [Paracoccus sp. (in: a-proteobacteria)]
MARLLTAIVAAGMLPVAALSLQPAAREDRVPAAALPLLAGCGDIPEVVTLVDELRTREDRVAKALAELDNRKAEIEAARMALTGELGRLRAAGQHNAGSRSHDQRAVDEDVARLVAVYEAMKPKEAAAVLSGLPPEFSAELLMRVQPETGARIIAAIAPEQAAILTTYMGARRAPAR